jgi:N-hydroxyarylamine O-acetyltransferase
VLTALHEAHVGSIPFENLDVLLGKPIELDLPSVQAKLVTARRGGYCFEQNTLFRGALEAVGFGVTSLAARVRSSATTLRPRTHMVLLVNISGGPFLADVGFGGDGPVHPLPLVAAPERETNARGFQFHREGDVWVLSGDAVGPRTDLYAFTLEPHYPVDFEMANHFMSTHPRSPFLLTLTVQRSWPNRRLILRGRGLTVRDDRGSETTTLRDPDHLLEVLEREFGLVLPPGTRFPVRVF